MDGLNRLWIVGILFLSLFISVGAITIDDPVNTILTHTHDVGMNLSLTTENATDTTCYYEIIQTEDDLSYGNRSIDCAGGYISFPTDEDYTLNVYSWNTSGGEFLDSDTTAGYIVREDGEIIIFMILLLFVFIAVFLVLLFKNIELIALADFSLQYVIANFVFFFSLIAFKFFYSEFVKFGFEELLMDLIYISAVSHILLAILGFILTIFMSFIKLQKKTDRANAGDYD